MRNTVLWMTGAILCLTGCERTERPPTEAGAASTQSAEAPEFMRKLWAKEAPLTVATSGAVERKGNILTLRNNGVVVATLTDTNGDCWFFTNSFQAKDTAGRLRSFYVFRHTEENDSPHYGLIVDDSGAAVGWVPEDVIIFDGPLIASGNVASDGSTGGTFQIDDWRSFPRLHYTFDIGCTPDKWLSADQVRVLCPSPDSDEMRPATVKRLNRGAWQFEGMDLKAKGHPVESMTAEQAAYTEKLGLLRFKPDAD